MKNIPLYVFLLVLFSACNTLKYTSSTEKVLPELGTIGVFKEFVLHKSYEGKSVITLEQPLRLQWQEMKVSERQFFKKSDSKAQKTDSTLLIIEVLDQLGLIQQINQDIPTLSFLKKAEECQIITGVTLSYSEMILDTFRKADEAYLIQNKEKTLSIELRQDNKFLSTVEFSQGTIIAIQKASFCWGQNKRKEVVIFDLTSPGMSCSNDTYRTARQAKKKNEFNFFK
ncbi:MAG: hypothetical protein AAF489_13055 [Bacteroidota bacterium]